MRIKALPRTTIKRAAYLAALLEYRAAMRSGRLGEVHTGVVDEVYGIASDELLSRATQQRRAARWWLLCTGVWAAGAIAVLALVGGTHMLETHRGWVWWPVAILGSNMFERYAAANAFRHSAWMLERPRYAAPVPGDDPGEDEST